MNKKPTIIPCVSIWSILELRQKPKLYKLFLELFSILPFCLLKPPNILLTEEFDQYPNFSKIDPILFTFSVLKGPDKSLEKLMTLIFQKKDVIKAEKMWRNIWKQQVLDSILSLKNNFFSKNKYYNSTDAKNFVSIGVPQYLASENPAWVKKKLKLNEEININAFPSVKISFYNVFYRFYLTKRIAGLQDVFDITINNSVPYLDFVLTENFQADIFEKVKSNDEILNGLEIKTIKDLM